MIISSSTNIFIKLIFSYSDRNLRKTNPTAASNKKCSFRYHTVIRKINHFQNEVVSVHIFFTSTEQIYAQPRSNLRRRSETNAGSKVNRTKKKKPLHTYICANEIKRKNVGKGSLFMVLKGAHKSKRIATVMRNRIYDGSEHLCFLWPSWLRALAINCLHAPLHWNYSKGKLSLVKYVISKNARFWIKN